MTTLRAAIGAIWLVSFIVGRGAWPPDDPSAIAATSADFTRLPDRPAPEPPLRDQLDNEIERALADYRVDLRGGVYERHSPDTAAPRLGLPTT